MWALYHLKLTIEFQTFFFRIYPFIANRYGNDSLNKKRKKKLNFPSEIDNSDNKIRNDKKLNKLVLI